jgi:hypothetical protein
MTANNNVDVRCRLVGEYVDEAEVPISLQKENAPPSLGQVDRPRLVANFLDYWGQDDELKAFTVKLRDGSFIHVKGHGLKYLQNQSNSTDFGSYGVVLKESDGETLVALFRAEEVTGIFHGDFLSATKT